MCILVVAFHDCGHEGHELRRERCIIFYGALILMIRDDNRYDKEIEDSKKDCVTLSEAKHEPRIGLCLACRIAAAAAHLEASQSAESEQDDIGTDDTRSQASRHEVTQAVGSQPETTQPVGSQTRDRLSGTFEFNTPSELKSTSAKRKSLG